jgi:ligand-binding sensor domain-containing protein
VGDDKGTWIGTDYGVVSYVIADDRFTAYADFASLPSLVVTSLAFDSAWVYIGTDNGLGFMKRDLEKKHKKRGKQRSGDSLQADSSESPVSSRNLLRGWRINTLKVIDGFLYVGTNRGVLRRAAGDYGDFQFLNTPEKMLTDDILDMARLGDSLFFLTKNDIIIINTKTGETGTIADQSHFGSWHMRKFAVDSLHIWAATDIGLWMYRFSDGYRRLFTVNDGMLSDDIRSIEMVGDYIWMATPKGVIRFYWNRPGRVD